MAGSSFFLLLDDIAALLDDVAIMAKVAAKKTAGVLGDDLALNANQVTGVKADRELPVVWTVFKGSLLNKFILVPAALAISVFLPWLIIPLLMLGGAFLCFEGFEKVLHTFFHKKDAAHHEALVKAVADPEVDMVAFEKKKIRGAIQTDFILSAEIIVITLGTVAAATFLQQVLVLSVIALGMTIGVYGLVAGIVKLDDAGLYLSHQKGMIVQRLGRLLLAFAPIMMKGLSILGTIAMFLVGGGILIHGIPFLEHALHHFTDASGQVISMIIGVLFNGIIGLAFGGILVAIFTGFKKIKNR